MKRLLKINTIILISIFVLILLNFIINYELNKKVIDQIDITRQASHMVNGRDNKTIILLGSSVTYGKGASVSSNSWASLLRTYIKKNNYDINFINLGVGGFTTEDILNSTYWITANSNPDLIIFEDCLINDFVKGFTTKQSEKNIYTIVNGLRNRFPNTKVYIMPPNNISKVYPHNKENLSYQDYVKNVGNYIKYQGWSYLDFWNSYSNELRDKGITLKQSLLPDEIHPNDIGYKIWFDSIKGNFKIR